MAGGDITRMGAVAKLKAGRISREVADWLRIQFHGGMGYIGETWTARHLRDARLVGIAGGADEVMLSILARLDGLPPPDVEEAGSRPVEEAGSAPSKAGAAAHGATSHSYGRSPVHFRALTRRPIDERNRAIAALSLIDIAQSPTGSATPPVPG